MQTALPNNSMTSAHLRTLPKAKIGYGQEEAGKSRGEKGNRGHEAKGSSANGGEGSMGEEGKGRRAIRRIETKRGGEREMGRERERERERERGRREREGEGNEGERRREERRRPE